VANLAVDCLRECANLLIERGLLSFLRRKELAVRAEMGAGTRARLRLCCGGRSSSRCWEAGWRAAVVVGPDSLMAMAPGIDRLTQAGIDAECWDSHWRLIDQRGEFGMAPALDSVRSRRRP